jgi:S1-C subfamily serine protease
MAGTPSLELAPASGRARSHPGFWARTVSHLRLCAPRIVVSGALGLFACGGTDRSPPDPSASVVAIGATGCRRTSTRAVGVVVADGLVATVAHAVAGESEITVVAPDGSAADGTVAAIDTDVDAALIRIDGLDLTPLPRATYDEGDVSLWTSDHGAVRSAPAEILRRVEVRTSDIYREGEHLRPGFELRAEVAAGDSGSGLVDDDGQLVGLVWATSRERPERAWAMPIEALDPLLDAAQGGQTPPAARCSR